MHTSAGGYQMSADDTRTVYAAVVDYHNGLVETRFTVAGLYVAANGFLASGFFLRSSDQSLPWFALPALGATLTIVCWLLELRTYHLLSNLGTRGADLERHMGVDVGQGFFSLMQPPQGSWFCRGRSRPAAS